MLLITSLLGVIATIGCGDAEEHVQLDGNLSLEGCGEFFPWEPNFASYSSTKDGGVLRFYHYESVPTTQNNTFVITFNERDTVSSSIGTPIPVESGLVHQPATTATGSMTFKEFCEDARDTTAFFEGTITFNSFGTSDGDTIKGTLAGNIVSGREPYNTIGSMHGTFEFFYRPNRPYQPFP